MSRKPSKGKLLVNTDKKSTCQLTGIRDENLCKVSLSTETDPLLTNVGVVGRHVLV